MLMRLFLAQLDKRYGPMVFLCLLDSLGPFKSEPSLAVLVYFASYRATPEDWSCLPHQTLAVAPIPCEVILHPVTNEQYDGSGEDGDTGASAGMPRLLATGHGIVPSKAALLCTSLPRAPISNGHGCRCLTPTPVTSIVAPKRRENREVPARYEAI